MSTYTIGILSGQGALSGFELGRRLTLQWAVKHHPQNDFDYPSFLLESIPMQCIDLEGHKGPMLDKATCQSEWNERIDRMLNQCDTIAIACNSTWYYVHDRVKSDPRIFHPWNAALEEFKDSSLEVWSSQSMRKQSLPPNWRTSPIATQSVIDYAIEDIVAGRLLKARDALKSHWTDRGRPPLLLACTELSAVHHEAFGQTQWVMDSMDAMIHEMVKSLSIDPA